MKKMRLMATVVLCMFCLAACGKPTESMPEPSDVSAGVSDLVESDVQLLDSTDSSDTTGSESDTGATPDAATTTTKSDNSTTKKTIKTTRKDGSVNIQLSGSDTSGQVKDLKGRVVRYQISPNEDKTSSGYKRLTQNIANIEEKLNCKVQLVENIGESGNDTSIVTSILSGAPIVDIWIQNTTAEFISHYKAGLVQNLSDLHVFDFEKNDWDPCMENMQFGGKYYGIRSASAGNMTMNSLILCFNDKLLNEYIPQYADKLYEWQKNGQWTWDRFEEVCKAFNQASGADPSLVSCFDRSGASYLVMLADRGVDWLKYNDKGQLVFNGNDKKAQEAMNQFKDYVSKDVIVFENAKNVNFGWDANMTGWNNDGRFLDGQCLFAFNSIGGYYWNVFQFAGTVQSVRNNAGFMMVPKLKESDAYTHTLPIYVQGYCIPSGVEKPAEVATVLNMLQVEPTVELTESEARQEAFAVNIEPTLNKVTSDITTDAFFMTYDGFKANKGYALQSSMAISASTNIWGDEKTGWIGRYLYDISHGDVAQSAAVAAVTKKYNNTLSDLFETR